MAGGILAVSAVVTPESEIVSAAWELRGTDTVTGQVHTLRRFHFEDEFWRAVADLKTGVSVDAMQDTEY